jgi:hypothetical protein
MGMGAMTEKGMKHSDSMKVRRRRSLRRSMRKRKEM